VVTAYSYTGFCPGIDTIKFTLGYDTARFGLNPPNACLGKLVTFKDSSTGPPNTWSWNFGDPGSGASDSSKLQNPTHIFSGPGTFTVQLIVGSAGCQDTTTKVVTMNPVAVANFTGDSVCLHDSTQFTDMSTIVGGSITGWSWNFGDPPSGANNTSTLQNPKHVFSGPGTYTVTLTAQTAAGCDSTIKKTVTVYPPPVAKFTNTKACAGSATSFTDMSTVSSGTIASWNWTFGDGGLSNVQNPSHTYPAAGTYNAVLVVTSSNGCIDSVKQVVRVNPNPVVAFTADTLSGCTPLCVKYTDKTIISSGNDVTWNWNLGGGFTSASQNPSQCYTTPGSYNITLTVTSDSGCTSSQTVNNMINVYGKPIAAFTTSATVVDLYDPVVQFTSTSTSPGDSIVSYSWIFTDSAAMGPNVTRTFSDTGTYCGTLKVTNSHGCVDSTEQCVVVEANFTLYIPDAFSPNGNGLNDVFKPKGMYIQNYDMYIFDRWGLLLFHTNDLTKGWDGTTNKHVCQEDTYVYLIKINDTQGKKHSYLGKVSLLK
jgi:gliding motility-associated-like protein